jgi:hypothetical protein
MRNFVTVQTVVLNKNLVTKARDFAKQVTPTVGVSGKGYADANQFNLQKIEHDHCVSKLGEEAVRIIFEQQHRQVWGPDYHVYQSGQKSWAADLYIDGTGLAVKTQTVTSAQRFGLSWTFQAGAFRKDPILNQPDAWVCFVALDEVTHYAKVYPPYQIKELKFEAPKLHKLKGSKKVVYAASLMVL